MLPLVFTSLLLAQPPSPGVTLPDEVSGRPGRIVKLKAETSGPNVRWYLVSDEADLVPFPDGKVALFSCPKAGRYTVLAWTAAGDVPSEAAKCVVVIDDPPAPPVPPPVDPFSSDVRKLFAADSTPDKSKHAAQLAALYREATAFAEKADVATTGDLAARIRTAAGTLVPADALVNLRKRVAEEIAKDLSADAEKPLDAATRTKAAKLFDRIATTLEELK